MTQKKVEKPIETVVVTYEEFSEWEHVPYGSFFIRNALGMIVYYKTSDRLRAQKACDEEYGKGKYTVIPSKQQKTKPRTEFGLSATGSNTRRGFMKKG